MSSEVDNVLMAFVGLLSQVLFIFYSTVTNIVFLVLLAVSSGCLYKWPALLGYWWYPTPLVLTHAPESG